MRKGVPLFERTQTWISAGPQPTLSKEEEETADPLEDSNYPNTLVSHRGREVLTETDTSPVGFFRVLWGSGHSFHEVKNEEGKRQVVQPSREIDEVKVRPAEFGSCFRILLFSFVL